MAASAAAAAAVGAGAGAAGAEGCGRGLRSAVAVLSRVPGLVGALSTALPQLTFRDLSGGGDGLGKPKWNFTDPAKGLRGEALAALQEAEVLVADNNLLAPHLYDLPRARLVQGTWAGVDAVLNAYDPSKPPPGFVLSRFSGEALAAQMAEYVVAAVVGREREYGSLRDAQRARRWERRDLFPEQRCIFDLTFAVLGVGAIGTQISRALSTLGGRVWGVGRSERAVPPPHTIEYRPISRLSEALAVADYVVSALPGGAGTTGLLGGGVLRACEARGGAVLVNVGRGNVIPEAELVEALQRGWLRGAALDVFEHEPLAADSPLWDMPQVDITPHVAGVTRAHDVAICFKENLQRYLANQPPLHVLDWVHGY